MAKEREFADLAPEQRFAAAGRVIIRRRFADMWTHRDGVLSGDIEAVHDMRVGSRRLRAALDVFAPAFPGGEYRRLSRLTGRLTAVLGRLRDLDVMLLNIARYGEAMSGDERAGIDDLARALSLQRALERQQVRVFLARLDKQDYAARMRHLLGEKGAMAKAHAVTGLQPNATLLENARPIVSVRVAEMSGYADAIGDPALSADLHHMRIAAKRLRYTLEMFRVCLGPDGPALIETVKELQGRIGAIHDADVFDGIIRGHLAAVAQRQAATFIKAGEHGDEEERVTRVREAVYSSPDPRLGLAIFSARVRARRDKAFSDLTRWWAEHGGEGLRVRLDACLRDMPVSVDPVP